MKNKPIILVGGEPYSIFFEIFFKSLKKTKIKNIRNPIILIASKKLLAAQMKSLNYNFKIVDLSLKDLNLSVINNKQINIININFKFKKAFSKISKSSNEYIKECFDKAISLIKLKKIKKLINGPISKIHFLQKKFPGITEYVASITKTKDLVMLIYNEKMAVCPLTTHVPIKNVSQHVKKRKIINTVNKINDFYKNKLRKKPKIALLGLNPHCETTNKISEEKEEIIPAIKFLNLKRNNVSGPFSADTFFLKKNIEKYDVVIGMYHDQVLTPIKTLFDFKAINVTVGLPFIKVTPDHGPNFQMIGKNKSDPASIFYALNFLNKIK